MVKRKLDSPGRASAPKRAATEVKTEKLPTEPAEKRESSRAFLVLADVLLDKPIFYELKKPCTTFGFTAGMKRILFTREFYLYSFQLGCWI